MELGHGGDDVHDFLTYQIVSDERAPLFFGGGGFLYTLCIYRLPD